MSAIWRALVRYAPYVYLTRFPLLLAVCLVGFVPVALVWVKPLFRSMLIQDFSGVLWTTFATWLAAFTVMATRRVTLLYGARRFNCEPLIDRPTHVGVKEAFVHAFVAFPLLAAVGWLSATENHLGWRVAPAILGHLACRCRGGGRHRAPGVVHSAKRSSTRPGGLNSLRMAGAAEQTTEPDTVADGRHRKSTDTTRSLSRAGLLRP